jgi:hypothetical protein
VGESVGESVGEPVGESPGDGAGESAGESPGDAAGESAGDGSAACVTFVGVTIVPVSVQRGVVEVDCAPDDGTWPSPQIWWTPW